MQYTIVIEKSTRNYATYVPDLAGALGLDRGLEHRCFRWQSQTQLESHHGQARMHLAHRAEQVFSFVFGHILWIVGEHCLRTRGDGWIVDRAVGRTASRGLKNPRGS